MTKNRPLTYSTYTYYDNGSKQRVEYPDGSKEEYTYYANNLLNTLTNRNTDWTVIDTYSYTYDSANNQTSKTDARGTTSYTYDDMERLRSVSEPSGKVTSYTFDLAGNRATETITESVYSSTYSSYSYNEQNRLTGIETWVDGTPSIKIDYTYDNNGNQLTVAKAVYDEVYGGWLLPTMTINVYDKLNQLVRTTTPENKVITNTYDGEGKRTVKNVDGETTRYLYEYDKVVLETDEYGNQKARNVHGTSLISRDTGGLTGYYFYNGHGDVTVIQDVYGNQLGLYYYDAFGNPETVQESVYEDVYESAFNNPFRYAEYYYDEETGTYYLMARFYDPETARFLQEDSYRGQIYDPLSLNYYTYAHNEPIMYIDPTGHWRDDAQFFDRSLNENARVAVSKLTDLYYAAKTDEERNMISKQADAIRNDKGNWSDKKSNTQFNQKASNLIKSGKMNADTWKDISTTIDSKDVQSALSDGEITFNDLVNVLNYKTNTNATKNNSSSNVNTSAANKNSSMANSSNASSKNVTSNKPRYSNTEIKEAPEKKIFEVTTKAGKGMKGKLKVLGIGGEAGIARYYENPFSSDVTKINETMEVDLAIKITNKITIGLSGQSSVNLSTNEIVPGSKYMFVGIKAGDHKLGFGDIPYSSDIKLESTIGGFTPLGGGEAELEINASEAYEKFKNWLDDKIKTK